MARTAIPHRDAVANKTLLGEHVTARLRELLPRTEPIAILQEAVATRLGNIKARVKEYLRLHRHHERYNRAIVIGEIAVGLVLTSTLIEHWLGEWLSRPVIGLLGILVLLGAVVRHVCGFERAAHLAEACSRELEVLVVAAETRVAILKADPRMGTPKRDALIEDWGACLDWLGSEMNRINGRGP